MMTPKVAKVTIPLFDVLQYKWEGRDPERKHAIMFGIAVKNGIRTDSIKRIDHDVDHDTGVLEYYTM